jgi:ABC-2 type transport system ATP-binding protein
MLRTEFKDVQQDCAPVIRVENLVKRYHNSETAAVDGLSFDVRPGEFFALLGPNGAGKTTTISILTTTLAKTTGTVTIGGYDLDRKARDVRQSIGIIFQNPSLDLNLTAEENIRFHVSLYGIYGYRPSYRLMPMSYQERVTELADVLGITGEIFRQVKTFSGGMKRKLEIMRSLMHDPKILFLDEPTTGLDAVGRASLWEYLQKIHREKKMTIFLTTHYIEEAEAADRICIVNHGRMAFSGSPEEMKHLMVGRYLLLDAEDRASLRSELAGFGPETVEDGRLKVRFSQSTPQNVLSQIKTPLSFMHLHEPSLEEAYIDLVSNGREQEEVS